MSTTPYMNLDLPVPSVTEGPEWAESVVEAFETVDSHDHTPGNGVPINSAAIELDADLSFDGFKATEVQAVILDPQASSLSAANTSALYSIDGDFWYNNSTGTPVQITDGNSLASASSPLVPAGVIWPYGGSSAPTGFLLCNGSAISRATYSDLFAVIGTLYGVGDGATTFNLPNANGRTAVGAGNYTDPVSGSVTRSLGASAGAEKHVITTAEMATHNHGGGSHTHFTHADVSTTSTTSITALTSPARTRSAGDNLDYQAVSQGTGPTVGLTSNSGATVTSNGSDSAHNNMQPYFVTNYIIKT